MTPVPAVMVRMKTKLNKLEIDAKNIYRRLSRCKQLGGLVPVFRLGVPIRYKASKLWYSLKIPMLYEKRTLV